ncbi:MAG: phosphatidate cytidylyltransferase [Proteobacteria bacterium]|nr:phosphatidate cytidylyltransferase [Pseudomonadota bacterium]
MKLPRPDEITRSLEDMLRRRGERGGSASRERDESASRANRAPRERRARKGERKPGARHNLLSRAITGLSLSGLTALLIIIHPHAFALEAMFFTVIGLKEMCDLASRNGVSPSYPVALPCSLAILAAASWAPAHTPLVLALSVIFTLTCMTFRRRPAAAAQAGGFRGARYLDGIVTVFSFLYVGWLFGFCLQVRNLPGRVAGPNGLTIDAGAAYLIMLISVTAFSDVGAFTFGRLFGRHPLAPEISPGKTVEGTFGGILTSAVGAVAFGLWLGLAPAACALTGVLLSVAGQLGDLWESMMKRDAGIKDSGRALAGHGGVLDRCDSLFYAMPVGYLLLTYVLL